MSQQITKQDIVEIIGKSTQDLLEVVNESFSRIEAKMVTKDYLEAELVKHNFLPKTSAKKILTMEPFPQNIG